MKRIVFEIPDFVHKAIKNRCFAKDISMREYITELLIEDLKLREQQNANK